MALILVPSKESQKIYKMTANYDVLAKSIVEHLGPEVYGKELRDCLGHSQNVLKKRIAIKWPDGIVVQMPSVLKDKRIGTYTHYMWNVIGHCRNAGITVEIQYI